MTIKQTPLTLSRENLPEDLQVFTRANGIDLLYITHFASTSGGHIGNAKAMLREALQVITWQAGRIAELEKQVRQLEEHKELRALLITQELTGGEDIDILLWIRFLMRTGRIDPSLRKIIADDGVRTREDMLRDLRTEIGMDKPEDKEDEQE